MKSGKTPGQVLGAAAPKTRRSRLGPNREQILATRREIGNRLRGLRELAGKSREELGKFIGCSHQLIGKYESGELDLTYERRKAICEFFAVSEVTLTPEGWSESLQTQTDAEGEELRAIFNRIKDPETRSKLLQKIDAVAKIMMEGGPRSKKSSIKKTAAKKTSNRQR